MSKSNHSAAHAKIHTLTGYGVMVGLLGAIYSVAKAVPTGAEGITAWLSNPVGGSHHGLLRRQDARIWPVEE